MLRVDLAAAGVPSVVEGVAGKEYADFHALRHSFVSAIGAAGADAKALHTLARRSDPRLTLGTYSHAREATLVEAGGRLQIPGAWLAASPFAHHCRTQLDGLALGLCVTLGGLLNTPSAVTPAAGSTGDPVGLLRTNAAVSASGV